MESKIILLRVISHTIEWNVCCYGYHCHTY